MLLDENSSAAFLSKIKMPSVSLSKIKMSPALEFSSQRSNHLYPKDENDLAVF